MSIWNQTKAMVIRNAVNVSLGSALYNAPQRVGLRQFRLSAWNIWPLAVWSSLWQFYQQYCLMILSSSDWTCDSCPNRPIKRFLLKLVKAYWLFQWPDLAAVDKSMLWHLVYPTFFHLAHLYVLPSSSTVGRDCKPTSFTLQGIYLDHSRVFHCLWQFEWI